MEINDLNPWWITSTISEEIQVLPKRTLFYELQKYLTERQILCVTGLRRVGKTTIMHHLIDILLKEHSKESIFYFSYDLFNGTIEEILGKYQEIQHHDFRTKKTFLFLDEVQQHDNWEKEVKMLYDLYPHLKIFITGSSSLFIEKKSKESLAGRAFSFLLSPLTFSEYLTLKKIAYDPDKISLYKNELVPALHHYIRSGGFPELLFVEDQVKIATYIKETIINRVIFIDIPATFNIEEPELLSRLLSIISQSPGQIIDYESLASDLQRNRKTISNYIFYLEKAFLIKKVYNFSSNLLTSEKKAKKIYPASSVFAQLFEAQEGKIIETSILMNVPFTFFYRHGNTEVDFVGMDKVPFEIKYTNSIKDKDLRGILLFLKKNNGEEGWVISKEAEFTKTIKGKTIVGVPLWKWLLKEQ